MPFRETGNLNSQLEGSARHIGRHQGNQAWVENTPQGGVKLDSQLEGGAGHHVYAPRVRECVMRPGVAGLRGTSREPRVRACSIRRAGTEMRQNPQCQGLINWLQQHRLPFFCRTELYLHYLLCIELLPDGRQRNYHHEAKKARTELHGRDKCTHADRWLLRRCIGSVRGILRFRSFLRGTAGEELTSFWLSAERILGVDEHSESQQDLYLSLLRILMVTHLRAGSAVLETCSISSESVLQLRCWHPPGLRREVLQWMQAEALQRIQQYCVPAFLSHCRVCLSRLPEGHALLELSQQKGTLDQQLPVHIPMSILLPKEPSKTYSSKDAKRRVWHLLTSGRGNTYPSSPKKPTNQYPSTKKDKAGRHSPHLESQKQNDFTPRTQEKTPSPITHQNFQGEKQQPDLMNHLLPPHPPSSRTQETPIIYPFSSLGIEVREGSLVTSDWLHWALSGEEYAGSPFRAFLMERGSKFAAQLVNLWQELGSVLQVLLTEGSLALCQALSDRLLQHYLHEKKEGLGLMPHSPKPNLSLTSHIATRLRELLPFRDAAPWVLQAQSQICQSLGPLYEQFLDAEDKTFLQFLTSSSQDISPRRSAKANEGGVNNRIMQKLKTALALARACSLGGELEPLDTQGWKLMLAEDISQGGSIQPSAQPVVYIRDYSTMSFAELALWNPKLAIEKLSKEFREFCGNRPSTEQIVKPVQRSVRWQKGDPLFMRKGAALLRKPLCQPRSLLEVLHHPVHLELFRQYLRVNNAEAPLNFWLSVEKLISVTDPKAKRTRIKGILKRFFKSDIRPEILLQCDAIIIREIPKMSSVSTNILMSAQSYVLKSMEEKWFKGYQDTYPAPTDGDSKPQETILKQKRGSAITAKLKNIWMFLTAFVRCMCKFRRTIYDPVTRREYENFLREEVYNDLENLASPPSVSSPRSCTSSPQRSHATMPRLITTGYVDESEIVHIRRRSVNNRVIIVNYAINDLSFYIEIERYMSYSIAARSQLGTTSDQGSQQQQCWVFRAPRVAI
ncbi:hypothetical protein FKM82_002168, partial [Ascaphus truei]